MRGKRFGGGKRWKMKKVLRFQIKGQDLMRSRKCPAEDTVKKRQKSKKANTRKILERGFHI